MSHIHDFFSLHDLSYLRLTSIEIVDSKVAAGDPIALVNQVRALKRFTYLHGIFWDKCARSRLPFLCLGLSWLLLQKHAEYSLEYLDLVGDDVHQSYREI